MSYLCPGCVFLKLKEYVKVPFTGMLYIDTEIYCLSVTGKKINYHISTCNDFVFTDCLPMKIVVFKISEKEIVLNFDNTFLRIYSLETYILIKTFHLFDFRCEFSVGKHKTVTAE